MLTYAQELSIDTESCVLILTPKLISQARECNQWRVRFLSPSFQDVLRERRAGVSLSASERADWHGQQSVLDAVLTMCQLQRRCSGTPRLMVYFLDHKESVDDMIFERVNLIDVCEDRWLCYYNQCGKHSLYSVVNINVSWTHIIGSNWFHKRKAHEEIHVNTSCTYFST